MTEGPQEQKAGESNAGDGMAFQIAGMMTAYPAVDDREDGESGLDEAGNYLDGEVSGRIDTLVANYQTHLGTVEKEVNHQLHDQAREQDRANRDYQKFLEDLGKDAQDTNQAEQKKLTTAIDLFYTAKEETSRENQDLLADFAAKLPFSRNQSTLNKEVVEFTAAPLAFTDIQVRPVASVNEQRQKQLLRNQIWPIRSR